MRTLVEAYIGKYEDMGDPGENNFGHIQVYVPKSAAANANRGRLAMDNCEISTVGEVTGSLADTFSKVRELDLTKNLISDWNQLLHIFTVFPHLELLNITMNPLDGDTFTETTAVYPQMKTFILNNTRVSWAVVSKLLPCFPSLSELHLSINNYQSVDLQDGLCHEGLTKLYMNDCNISNWEDVRKLGRTFLSLESLTIINTNITCLSDDQMYAEFPKLSCLNIGQCCLGCWEELDKFGRFPALIHLRISGVPFLESVEQKPRRQQLVARLPALRQLNGSRITETEREDAERAFIRVYMDMESPPPRYHVLVEKYGKLDPLAHVDLTPKNTLSLLVRYENKSEIMEVNLRQTVQEFKKEKLQDWTGLPTGQMRLYYNEMWNGEIKDTTQLKFPSKTLLSLNINEGDEFEICKKPS